MTGYTCGGLFLSALLLDAAEEALVNICAHTQNRAPVVVLGVPLRAGGKLYNCAAVVCHGKLLGLVPKTHLPNYGEFYEKRQFNPAPAGMRTLHFAGQEVPFGTKLLFRCAEMPEFCLAAEVCEDLWAPLPPSTHHALAGATVIANLSASDETIGKADYRRALVGQQSARLLCTYLYADAGHGESTTDMVFAAHDLICENGALLAESRPFGPGYACTELDLGRMVSERCRSTTFQPEGEDYQTVIFHLPLREVPLTRPVSPTPFVPADDAARAERCELILAMQADGLAKRIAHAHAKTAVIGISGGKDSSTVAALAVAAYGKENVMGVLMPDGVQPDIDYSNGLVDVLNIRHYTFNIHGGTSGILDEMARVGIEASRQTKVNLPSRIRMATLYAIAQSEEGGIVINTSNLSEDWVGYCTIYGDSAGAFSPLGMYTTEEVIALGAELGLPERFLIKPPSDGLTGKTDEDNLGFTYHAVNEYIRKGEVDPAIKEQIDRKHKVSRFKFQTLPVYQNGLPIVLPEETDYYNPNKK